MSELTPRFCPAIPPGWCIWAADIEVAGTGHHIDAAIAFARAEGQYLTLEPEPTNPHDPKAVKVLGWTQQRGVPKSYFVGYVPKNVAEVMPPEYQPRIKNIWLGGYHRAVVYIRFDVLVPKEPKDPNRKKRPRRKRKVSAPVERPSLLQPPYLSDRPPERTHCEKCKAAHSGFDCPTCGNTHPGGGVGNSCDYCNTSYRESRRSCPVCTVEKHLKKATDAGARGNLSKAIGFWWQGYDEARSNGLGFSYNAFFPYAAFLAEAGFCNDAMALLSQLRNHRRSTLAASPRPVDLWNYYKELGTIHSAMSRALALGPSPLTANRQCDIIFHALLGELSERSGLHCSGYGTEPYPLTANRMREVLRQAKLNKKGRPEEAQQILVKHWYTVPKIDVHTLQQEVSRLVSTWLASSNERLTKRSVAPTTAAAQARPPSAATIPTAIPVPSPTVPPQQWFVILGDKQYGPFSSRRLRELAMNGKVVPDDLVRRADMDRTTHARHVKGLFPPPPTGQTS
jgi:hypothetical protein